MGRKVEDNLQEAAFKCEELFRSALLDRKTSYVKRVFSPRRTFSYIRKDLNLFYGFMIIERFMITQRLFFLIIKLALAFKVYDFKNLYKADPYLSRLFSSALH